MLFCVGRNTTTFVRRKQTGLLSSFISSVCSSLNMSPITQRLHNVGHVWWEVRGTTRLFCQTSRCSDRESKCQERSWWVIELTASEVILTTNMTNRTTNSFLLKHIIMPNRKSWVSGLTNQWQTILLQGCNTLYKTHLSLSLSLSLH